MPQSALVLGAGIQGVCIALALRRIGFRVTLVDQADECMSRASLHNEGKIHLGLVYAKDSSRRTGNLLLRAAMRFGPLIEKFCGRPFDWEALRAQPFTYLVLNDSMLRPDEVEAAYAHLEERYREERLEPGLHYLGRRPERLVARSTRPEPGGLYDPDRVLAVLQTAECPLRVARFREKMIEILEADSGVERLFGRKVETVERTASGFRVEGRGPDSAVWMREADIAVNCLWHGRLQLDEQMQVLPRRPWIYRLKLRVFAHLPTRLSTLPSLTMVVGPYGDIVVDPPGPAYLSWYPSSLVGWSDAVQPPAEWERICANRHDLDEFGETARTIVEGFESIIPGISEARVMNIAGGVIFSWGVTDIDDPESELHVRHEIGVESHDGYFSVNTGKFTCAPLFAEELVRRIEGAPSCL